MVHVIAKTCTFSGNLWLGFVGQQTGSKLKLFECHVTMLDWKHDAGGNVVIDGLLYSLMHWDILNRIMRKAFTQAPASLCATDSSISPLKDHAILTSPSKVQLLAFANLTNCQTWNVWKLPSVTVFVELEDILL